MSINTNVTKADINASHGLPGRVSEVQFRKAEIGGTYGLRTPMTEAECAAAFAEYTAHQDLHLDRETRMENVTVAKVEPRYQDTDSAVAGYTGGYTLAGGYRATGKRGTIHIDSRAVVPMVSLFTLGVSSIVFFL